jgi:hypothetical protein
MKIVIEVSDTLMEYIVKGRDLSEKQNDEMALAIANGTPLPKLLSKIKDDIGRYELDCRFADYSQTDECTICNKNVFESIYRIIDKYREGSDEE